MVYPLSFLLKVLRVVMSLSQTTKYMTCGFARGTSDVIL